MLRVSPKQETIFYGAPPEEDSPIIGSSKRWYTDDGRTFLPMADTAYYLFFEKPTNITAAYPLPTACPTRLAADVLPFIDDYVQAVAAHGINTLRVNALGSFGWGGAKTPPTSGACMTDLSLYWTDTIGPTAPDLFDAQPSILGVLETPAAPPPSGTTYYPNLESFRATDRKLQFLLNEHPGISIQMILLYDDATADNRNNHQWTRPTRVGGILIQIYRKQMWRNDDRACWAAFPNVFWTVENDKPDTTTEAQDLRKRAQLSLQRSPTLPCPNGVIDRYWRQRRPLNGFGHRAWRPRHDDATQELDQLHHRL